MILERARFISEFENPYVIVEVNGRLKNKLSESYPLPVVSD